MRGRKLCAKALMVMIQYYSLLSLPFSIERRKQQRKDEQSRAPCSFSRDSLSARIIDATERFLELSQKCFHILIIFRESKSRKLFINTEGEKEEGHIFQKQSLTEKYKQEAPYERSANVAMSQDKINFFVSNWSQS